MVLKNHELKAIKILCSSVLNTEQISSLETEAKLVSFQPTGVGYHLVVAHGQLPQERFVCNIPTVTGSWDNILVGYIVFLVDYSLHIDCHQLCDLCVPDDFREHDVQINS